MKVKVTDPKHFALTSAILISLVAIVITFLLFTFLVVSTFLLVILVGIAVFLFAYFFLKKIIESFIYDKIKIIYKTIHSLKRSKDDDKNKLVISGDTLEMVNQQVLEWGESKTRE